MLFLLFRVVLMCSCVCDGGCREAIGEVTDRQRQMSRMAQRKGGGGHTIRGKGREGEDESVLYYSFASRVGCVWVVFVVTLCV